MALSAEETAGKGQYIESTTQYQKMLENILGAFVAHTYNTSTEDEAGGSLHVWSYFDLHNKFYISLE